MKTPNRCEYRIRSDDWYATQVERSVHVVDRASRKVLKVIRPPAAWGQEWTWTFIDGGVAVEHSING
jgi:hypothetical protein